MRKRILYSVLFLIVILVAYLIGKSSNPSGLEKNKLIDTNIKVCTRTENYSNPPEFERALSLIKQRYTTLNLDTTSNYDGKEIKMAELWKNILPCLIFKYTNARQDKNAEGYFKFGGNNTNPNYLPIYVDQTYSESDDLLLAFLLVHEITHAQQYLYELNKTPDGFSGIPCFTKETAAFGSQWYFYNLLNNEEKRSLGSRIVTLSDQPQLLILKRMIEYYWDDLKSCNKSDPYCVNNKVVDSLDREVKQNEFYQKECNSN